MAEMPPPKNIIPGFNVVSADGERLGRVAAIEGDYIVVPKGFFFPTDVYIPMSSIAEVTDNVYLQATKEEALNQRWDRIPASDTARSAYGGYTYGGGPYGGSGATTVGGESPATQVANGAPDRVHAEDRNVGDQFESDKAEESLTAASAASDLVPDRAAGAEVVQSSDEPITAEYGPIERSGLEGFGPAAEDLPFEDAIEIPVTGHEAELGKPSRVVEEVDISKDRVQDIERVTDTVRREDMRVPGGTDEGRSGSPHSSERGESESPPTEPTARRPLSRRSRHALAIADIYRQALHERDLDVASYLGGLQVADRGELTDRVLRGLGIEAHEVLRAIAIKREIDEPSGFPTIDSLQSVQEPDDERLNSLVALINNSQHVAAAMDEAQSIPGSGEDGAIEPCHLLAALSRLPHGGTPLLANVVDEDKAIRLKALFDGALSKDDFNLATLQRRILDLHGKPIALRDAPATEDALGFDATATVLADLVRQTEPPLVIGIYGPWGSGKSTLMRLVEAKLNPRAKDDGDKPTAWSKILAIWKRPVAKQTLGKKMTTLWYDAWAYSDSAKLWSGLVTDVAGELDAELGLRGRVRYLAKHHTRKVLARIAVSLVAPVVGVLALLAAGMIERAYAGYLGVTAAGGGLIGVYALASRRPVESMVDSITGNLRSEPSSGVAHDVQQQIKTALETRIAPFTGGFDEKKATIALRVTNSKDLRLIVFIDELDRCPLERIVDILEAIKLFLAEELFVVFLAIDTRVAASAIRARYKDADPDLPREYLEKIVQLPLQVPTPSVVEVDTYLKGLMHGPTAEVGQQSQGQDGSAGTGQPASPGTQTSAAGNEVTIRIGPFEATAGIPPTGRDPSRVQQDTTPGDSRTAASPATLATIGETKDERETLAKLGGELLEGNPRRIKRLLTTYRYVKGIVGVRDTDPGGAAWHHAVLTWLAFTLSWPAYMDRAARFARERDTKAVWGPEFLEGRIREWGAPKGLDKGLVTAHLRPSMLKVVDLAAMASNFLIETPQLGDQGEGQPSSLDAKVTPSPVLKRFRPSVDRQRRP
jgi:uncharacterized protein (TIGR02271 family)